MEAEELSGGVGSSFSAQGGLSRSKAVTTAPLSQPRQPREPHQLRHETCFFFYPAESELVIGDRFQAQLKLQACINQSGECASTSHLSPCLLVHRAGCSVLQPHQTCPKTRQGCDGITPKAPREHRVLPDLRQEAGREAEQLGIKAGALGSATSYQHNPNPKSIRGQLRCCMEGSREAGGQHAAGNW